MQVNTHYDFGLLTPLFKHVQTHYIDTPASDQDWSIRLYWTILQTMQDEGNGAHYQELKRMLNDQKQLYARRKTNSGHWPGFEHHPGGCQLQWLLVQRADFPEQ